MRNGCQRRRVCMSPERLLSARVSCAMPSHDQGQVKSATRSMSSVRRKSEMGRTVVFMRLYLGAPRHASSSTEALPGLEVGVHLLGYSNRGFQRPQAVLARDDGPGLGRD